VSEGIEVRAQDRDRPHLVPAKDDRLPFAASPLCTNDVYRYEWLCRRSVWFRKISSSETRIWRQSVGLPCVILGGIFAAGAVRPSGVIGGYILPTSASMDLHDGVKRPCPRDITTSIWVSNLRVRVNNRTQDPKAWIRSPRIHCLSLAELCLSQSKTTSSSTVSLMDFTNIECKVWLASLSCRAVYRAPGNPE
jgi:hypothetical protein